MSQCSYVSGQPEGLCSRRSAAPRFHWLGHMAGLGKL